MEQPLLSERDSGDRWSRYENVGRRGEAAIPTTEVSIQEIRSAASSCGSGLYPAPLIHAPPTSSPEPQLIPSVNVAQQAIDHQGGYEGNYGGTTEGLSRQTLDEVEIRELLIDHIGHRCCWGSQPARTWKIHAVEDCNVYVGTLDSFIEERETSTDTESYLGGNIDGKQKGPELGIWELDLRSQFPALFEPYKESRLNIPHSEALDKCNGCMGRGKVMCSACNAGQEPGFYKENQMFECLACHGRGLIAHRDGSDTICTKCKGEGKIPCSTCGSRGLVKCDTCNGSGSFLTRKVAIVRWKTLSTRKVSATSGAASVPDEVFHKAKGVQLCNTQAYQCTPAYFADSYFLNKFSSEVIADRAPAPPTARVICERHTISVIPVTRVTMANRGRSFSFYIIGFSREVYLKDYYPARFCWGLCPCLEWLKL